MATSTDDSVVLIVGQRPDPHIDRVFAHLRENGSTVVLLDRQRADEGIVLSLGFDGYSRRVILADSKEFDLAKVDAVWWRVKPNRPADFGFFEGSVEDAFITREWSEVLGSLSEIEVGPRWINFIPNHVRAGRKAYQLWLASSVGLRIPKTVISNSSESVLNTFPPDVPLIYKTLSSFIQPPDQIVFTQDISRDMLHESKDEIAVAPGIFQERIAKKHELRVTAVGETLFVVEIDSQSDRETATDWRRDQGRSMYRRGIITDETREHLRLFQSRAGLVFATYDMIVTPSGEEIFLECNPSGQWLWLEDALDLGISEALARILLSNRGH